MDFREPQYIAALARHKNITRAAEELGISQPSLSRFLSAAEKRYGIPFFQRLGKRLVITPAGQEYLLRSREIVNMGQQLHDRMRDLASRNGGHISIGITPSRGRYVLPNILPDFHDKYPDYEIELREGNVLEVEQMLEEGSVNLGLFNVLDEEYPSLVMEEICREEVLLCVGKRSPYPAMGQWRQGFGYPWVDLGRLGHETFLASSHSMRIGPVHQQLLDDYGIRPYTITTSDLDLNISLAAQGFGVCFCIEICADYCYTMTKPVFLSVGRQPVHFRFVAAYHKDSYLSEAARSLIAITKRVFAKDR